MPETFYPSRFLPIFVYLLKLLFQDGFSLHFPTQIHIIIPLGLDISENIRCSLYTLIYIHLYSYFYLRLLESPLKTW